MNAARVGGPRRQDRREISLPLSGIGAGPSRRSLNCGACFHTDCAGRSRRLARLVMSVAHHQPVAGIVVNPTGELLSDKQAGSRRSGADQT